MANFEQTMDPGMPVQEDAAVAQHGNGLQSRSMYIPSYQFVLRNLGLDQSHLEDEQTVTIPIKFMKMLMQFALAAQDFDENGYLLANHDVAGAVQEMNYQSGFAHYLECGYFEGRHNRREKLDEDWYLANYPDAAEEIRSGEFASAADHFYSKGAREGKAPNKMCLDDLEIWRYFTTVKK